MSSLKIGIGLSKMLCDFEFRVSNFESRISSFEFRTSTALLLGLLFFVPLHAEKPAQVRPASSEDFFIISSVDANKQELVLKHPTEVTELIRVTDRTSYFDEQGKPLQFKDLRAGDTVYVTLSRTTDCPSLASRIRKGPMTVEELHRRYLSVVRRQY